MGELVGKGRQGGEELVGTGLPRIAAAILSQRHEGWTLVPNRYDDGGFSGGNMERPGLKALLADIDAGHVDVIVVYKVDRLTKVQQRTSGPHRGGIPFRRGSLFYLLKNPVYRGKIVHRGKVYDGEHEAIVDEDLWNAVQTQLKEKAPPRKRSTNEPQQAMLRGLIIDPHGRPMVPTYATKRNRRYAYYETRKDLAPPADPPASRFGQGQLQRHLIVELTGLLKDEHALRRLLSVEEAGQLRALFATGRLFASQLALQSMRETALRKLVASLQIRSERIDVVLNAEVLVSANSSPLNWNIPLPDRKPFREAKLRIDAKNTGSAPNKRLVQLVADAFEARELIISNPGLSINQVARKEGRCRKQLTKLLHLSWLSPRIVEAIVFGTQPKAINRTLLLEAALPVDWAEQETLLGLSA